MTSCQDEVIRIGKKLEMLVSGKSSIYYIDLDLLSTLKRLPVTLEILQKTHIGVIVNNYRKQCKNKDGVSLAKELVYNWKKLLPAKHDQTASGSRIEFLSDTSASASRDHKLTQDKKQKDCSGGISKKDKCTKISGSQASMKTRPKSRIADVVGGKTREIMRKPHPPLLNSMQELTIDSKIQTNTLPTSKVVKVKTKGNSEISSPVANGVLELIGKTENQSSSTLASEHFSSNGLKYSEKQLLSLVCDPAQSRSPITDDVDESKMDRLTKSKQADGQTFRSAELIKHLSSIEENDSRKTHTNTTKAKTLSKTDIPKTAGTIHLEKKKVNGSSHSANTNLSGRSRLTEREKLKRGILQRKTADTEACKSNEMTETHKSMSSMENISTTVRAKQKSNKNVDDVQIASDVILRYGTSVRHSMQGNVSKMKTSEVQKSIKNEKSLSTVKLSSKYVSRKHVDLNSDHRPKVLLKQDNSRNNVNCSLQNEATEIEDQKSNSSETKTREKNIDIDHKRHHSESKEDHSMLVGGVRELKRNSESTVMPVFDDKRINDNDVKLLHKIIKREDLRESPKSRCTSKDSSEVQSTAVCTATVITAHLSNGKNLEKLTVKRKHSRSDTNYLNDNLIPKKSLSSVPKKQESDGVKLKYQEIGDKKTVNESLRLKSDTLKGHLVRTSSTSTESSVNSVKSTANARKRKADEIVVDRSISCTTKIVETQADASKIQKMEMHSEVGESSKQGSSTSKVVMKQSQDASNIPKKEKNSEVRESSKQVSSTTKIAAKLSPDTSNIPKKEKHSVVCESLEKGSSMTEIDTKLSPETVAKLSPEIFVKLSPDASNIPKKEKQNVGGGVRDKCREMISAALRAGETIEGSGDIDVLANAMEHCIFLEFKSTDMKYSNRVRSRITNLKDVKNPRLRENLLLGHITPALMAVMTTEDMASDAMKSLRAKFTKESIDDHQMDTQSGASSVMFRCSKCGMRDTTYNQVQLLCADEPMTTFVLCNNCGKRWRFN